MKTVRESQIFTLYESQKKTKATEQVLYFNEI